MTLGKSETRSLFSSHARYTMFLWKCIQHLSSFRRKNMPQIVLFSIDLKSHAKNCIHLFTYEKQKQRTREKMKDYSHSAAPGAEELGLASRPMCNGHLFYINYARRYQLRLRNNVANKRLILISTLYMYSFLTLSQIPTDIVTIRD